MLLSGGDGRVWTMLGFLDHLSGVYMQMFIAVVELMSSTYLQFHEHCRTWRNSVAQQPQDHSSRCRKHACKTSHGESADWTAVCSLGHGYPRELSSETSLDLRHKSPIARGPLLRAPDALWRPQPDGEGDFTGWCKDFDRFFFRPQKNPWKKKQTRSRRNVIMWQVEKAENIALNKHVKRMAKWKDCFFFARIWSNALRSPTPNPRGMRYGSKSWTPIFFKTYIILTFYNYEMQQVFGNTSHLVPNTSSSCV